MPTHLDNRPPNATGDSDRVLSRALMRAREPGNPERARGEPGTGAGAVAAAVCVRIAEGRGWPWGGLLWEQYGNEPGDRAWGEFVDRV